jgi:hypothetical protein
MEYSVKEFAKLAGVSTQAIYKQIGNDNSQIQPYVIRKGRLYYIKSDALIELYNQETTQDNPNSTKSNSIPTEENPEETQEQPGEKTRDNPRESLENDYIEFLKAQIVQKDREIEELHTLLSQSQHLQLASQARVKELEAHKEESIADEKEAPAETMEPIKKTLFQRFMMRVSDRNRNNK